MLGIVGLISQNNIIYKCTKLYNQSSNNKRNIFCTAHTTSARPEVRGTADVGWRSLLPLPFNPPRTHSRLYHHMCLRTDGQWRTWTERRGRCVAHHFCAVWGEGSTVCLGPRAASQRSHYTNYLRLGWWSTDRPLPMNDVRGRGVFNRGRAF